MAEDALDAKERLWNPQDWCWDPYNMLALASDRKGLTAAGKAVFGGLPYAVQPQLGPAASLLLDDVNRSGCRGKGPAVCQVDGCSAELTGLKEYHQRCCVDTYCLSLDCLNPCLSDNPNPASDVCLRLCFFQGGAAGRQRCVMSE